MPTSDLPAFLFGLPYLLLLGLVADGLTAALGLDARDLIEELEERVDEASLDLELHLLNIELESLVLHDVDVLLLDLGEGDQHLNERRVFLPLMLARRGQVQLLHRAEEDRHHVVQHVVDLDVVDLQVVLRHLLVRTLHLQTFQLLVLLLLLLSPCLLNELHLVDTKIEHLFWLIIDK